MKIWLMAMALVLSSPVWANITHDKFLENIAVQAIQTKNNLMNHGYPENEAVHVGIYSAMQWVIVIHERFQKESPFCNNLYDIGRGAVANRFVTKDMYQHTVFHVSAIKQLKMKNFGWRLQDFELINKRLHEITAQGRCHFNIKQQGNII